MSLTYSAAVEQTITAGEQIHQIVNGTATTEVTVEDGSKVPSIRKALLDNFYFKDPIAWQVGQTEKVFNQLRKFTDGSWWYAPSATASNPISMGSTPVGDSLWKIYDFDAIGKLEPRIDEALRRSYAEAGYNLVGGSFETGGTLVNTNDVLLHEASGKAFGWSGAFQKVVSAGSTPTPLGAGGWIDRSDVTLQSELASVDGAGIIGSATYSGIRAYTGSSLKIHCLGRVHAFDGASGDFHIDATDTSSADNDGTILIDAVGRRWKRQFAGDYQWQWWGVTGDGVTDDYLAIKKMIDSTGAFCGAAGVFAISQSLPAREGLRISITDNSGANAAGLVRPHSSVATPTAFDFFYANSAWMDHVTISGLRFFGGRHVIRGNFPSGVSSGFISQVNFESCVFQELAGYVIEATNSVFVIDFHRCRLIRCGGVNIGYGVNILKFRQCGFENMRREYIKLDGAGSSLPSASIGMYGCRCEGTDGSPTSSKCFDIKGYGRLFNIEITDGTYFENVFSDIGTLSGAHGLNITNVNFTNSDIRAHTLTIDDCNGCIGNFESLVPFYLNLRGSTLLDQSGHISGGVSVTNSGASQLNSLFNVIKTTTAPSSTPIYRFSIVPTGNTGATVYSAIGGQVTVTYASSRTDDGTPIFSSKTFQVVVSKMFGGAMNFTSQEVGDAGSLAGGSLILVGSIDSLTKVTLSVSYSGSGSYDAGAVISVNANFNASSSSENTISVNKV